MRFAHYSMLASLLLGAAAVSSTVCAAATVSQPTDRTITRAVKSQIDTAIEDADRISVKTSHDVVSLRGFADNSARKDQALGIARDVNGVQGVHDHLVISLVKKGSH